MRKGFLLVLFSMTIMFFLCANSNSVQAALAPEPDFHFTVPINVVNLHPDIRAVRITCSVSTGPSPFGGVNVGRGQVDFTLVGGSYRGTAIISFNANPGVEPGRAQSWGCSLRFIKTDGREVSSAQYCGDIYGSYPCQEGAPLKTSVTGSF